MTSTQTLVQRKGKHRQRFSKDNIVFHPDGEAENVTSKAADPLPPEEAHNHLRIEDVHSITSSFFLFQVYLAYALMLFCAYVSHFSRQFLNVIGLLSPHRFKPEPGYAPLISDLEYFWLTGFYQKIRDCFERPICTTPGPTTEVLDRTSPDYNKSYNYQGTSTKCINLASYNYLGFAETTGPVIDSVAKTIQEESYAAACPRSEGGNYQVVKELEEQVARFVGKEAAMVIGMGFATNSTTIPALGGPGTLIISDKLNHNSIVTGGRDASSRIKVFKHNDMKDLERLLRTSIIEGQPRIHRPWKKIFILVEGIYSMEGEVCNLREIVRLKKKYKAYLYVDEAHSIGALGQNGRGICEHTGVDPADVDILMGTFTKAFGSVGGYIASSQATIDYLRTKSFGQVYATAMSPACARQALQALKLVMGEDGTDQGQKRLQQLHFNSNFFRMRLQQQGFHVYGDEDSPVVLVMTYHPSFMPTLSRNLLKQGMAVVVVGFPVTPLLLSRIRFCVSAGHTKEQLEEAVQKFTKLGSFAGCQFAKYANFSTYNRFLE